MGMVVVEGQEQLGRRAMPMFALDPEPSPRTVWIAPIDSPSAFQARIGRSHTSSVP